MTDPRLDPPPGVGVRLVARTAAALLPLPSQAPPLDEIRRVLVVRTDDRVGNALLTIPLVRILQRALQNARVDLLLAAKRAQVAEGLPDLTVIRFDKRRPWRLPRRASYDVVVDAAHWHAFSLTSALVSRWAARRWLVGAERGPARRIYSVAVPPPAPGTAEVAAKVELAAALGLRDLAVPPLETALGRKPASFSLPPRFIALNPGARKADHRWNHFRTLVPGLPLPAVVVWGPGEEDLAAAVAAGTDAIVAPKTDLEQLAHVFRRAAVVVTNDSGPMHLAVACGAPVVGLFLDEAGLRWAAPGPRFRAVVQPTVETALAAVRDLLDTAAAPPESARSPEVPK
ncbi:MAG: glycosyltransferase family 9 protein [Myxococcales bacterium]